MVPYHDLWYCESLYQNKLSECREKHAGTAQLLGCPCCTTGYGCTVRTLVYFVAPIGLQLLALCDPVS